MVQAVSMDDAKNIIASFVKIRNSIIETLQKEDELRHRLLHGAATVAKSTVYSEAIVDCLRNSDIHTPVNYNIQDFKATLIQYSQVMLSFEQLRRNVNQYDGTIVQSIQRLQLIKSSWSWLFASKRKKENASEAMKALRSIKDGEYWETSIKALEKIRTNIVTQEQLNQFDIYISQYKKTFENNIIVSDEAIVSKQILSLLETHRSLSQRFHQISGLYDGFEDKTTKDAKEAVDNIITNNLLDELKRSDISTLQQVVNRLKIGQLRECGYNTIADVYNVSPANLASIDGINWNHACRIVEASREYASKLRTSIKIQVSVDKKTVHTQKLINSLYKIKKYRSFNNQFQRIKNLDKKALWSIRILETLKNNFSWIFAGEDEKKEYIKAFQQLDGMIEKGYSRDVNMLVSWIGDISSDEAWSDFEHNSVEFFTLLEELIPGVLGNGDVRYGLPEDLAREIQEQSFFPNGLNVTLRRYQEWGVKYILHQERVLLGDEMGLGKTVQAIATMVSLRNTGARRFMVVCPASVLPNWCKEIEKKSALHVIKIHGATRLSAKEEWLNKGGVAVTTYETLGTIDWQQNFRFDLLVVDEAHYIKNSEAKRSVNVKRIGQRAQRLLYMTGTALENRVDEMISLINNLQPEIANKANRWAYISSSPQFRDTIAPVYYRRKREDVLSELPQIIESKEWCSLSEEENEKYEMDVLSRNYADIRRVSWNIDNLKHSSKAQRMLEIIEESKEDGRKVLVFSFYLQVIKSVVKLLGNRCVPQIDGSVSVEKRQQIIDVFEKMPAGSVLPAQIQSGGTGLNIQAASVVIICEPQLKPSIENQAISRAYRMGQTRNVLVYRLLANDTIDERIDELLSRKQAIFDAFADKSTAAEKTEKEEQIISDKTLGKLVQEEIDRINRKKGNLPEDTQRNTENEHKENRTFNEENKQNDEVTEEIAVNNINQLESEKFHEGIMSKEIIDKTEEQRSNGIEQETVEKHPISFDDLRNEWPYDAERVYEEEKTQAEWSDNELDEELEDWSKKKKISEQHHNLVNPDVRSENDEKETDYEEKPESGGSPPINAVGEKKETEAIVNDGKTKSDLQISRQDNSDLTDLLIKLKELYLAGILTESEFTQKKQEILERISARIAGTPSPQHPSLRRRRRR